MALSRCPSRGVWRANLDSETALRVALRVEVAPQERRLRLVSANCAMSTIEVQVLR